MPPVKQNSTELFFPSNEATDRSNAVQVPKSLAQQEVSRLTRLSLLLWSFVTFVTTVIVVFYIANDFGLIPPSLLEQYVFVDRSTRLRILETQHHSLQQRLQILESRLNSLNHILQPLPDLQLDTLPSRLEATEAHVQSLSTLLEGGRPRNVALWADGARPIKALTSPTYKTKRNGFFQRLWHTEDTVIPPSHVLNGSPTPYCWEFSGSTGQFAVRLSEQSRLTSLSIFHAHRRTLSSVAASKIPKEFTLWGLYPNATSVPPASVSRPVSHFLKFSNPPSDIPYDGLFISLLNGTYDRTSPQTHQYFDISSVLLSALSMPIDIVVLEILSNWGSNTTCLYGVGFHVEPAN